jgi:hypothetical protein
MQMQGKALVEPWTMGLEEQEGCGKDSEKCSCEIWIRLVRLWFMLMKLVSSHWISAGVCGAQGKHWLLFLGDRLQFWVSQANT